MSDIIKMRSIELEEWLEKEMEDSEVTIRSAKEVIRVQEQRQEQAIVIYNKKKKEFLASLGI